MVKPRICMVDRTTYKYCPNCADYNADETWRFLFCCERCRDIYSVYEQYRDGHISAPDAKKELKALNVKDVDGLNERVGVVLKEILAYKAAPKRKKTKDNADDEHASEG